jgi:hypothetical protein
LRSSPLPWRPLGSAPFGDHSRWLSTASVLIGLAGVVQLEISGLFERWVQRYGDASKYPSGPPSHITRQLSDVGDPDRPARAWLYNVGVLGQANRLSADRPGRRAAVPEYLDLTMPRDGAIVFSDLFGKVWGITAAITGILAAGASIMGTRICCVHRNRPHHVETWLCSRADAS